MVWKIFNKNNNSTNQKGSSSNKLEVVTNSNRDGIDLNNDKDLQNFHQRKKDLLPDNLMTREDLVKEIQKLYSKDYSNNDPFKTREDRYFMFFNSNMSLNRPPVPFEEVKIIGKSFFIHKKFENGKVIIEEVYASPDLEINPKEEYAKQNTTKKQLEKINKEILFIKNKIAEGEEKFKLFDISDLIEEKLRLERKLDSIKYGKSSLFEFQNPINNKKSFWLRYHQGEYKYLKVTENNFIAEENSVRALRGHETQKKLESIINLRISTNWKQIIIGVLLAVFIVLGIFSFFKLSTFEEELFDKRVSEYCGGIVNQYEKQFETIHELTCEQKPEIKPEYEQVK